jgi:integrase
VLLFHELSSKRLFFRSRAHEGVIGRQGFIVDIVAHAFDFGVTKGRTNGLCLQPRFGLRKDAVEADQHWLHAHVCDAQVLRPQGALQENLFVFAVAEYVRNGFLEPRRHFHARVVGAVSVFVQSHKRPHVGAHRRIPPGGRKLLIERFFPIRCSEYPPSACRRRASQVAQAQKVAREWWRAEARREEGHDTRRGPLTIADAMADYLKAYERRGGKAAYDIRRVAETHILPALGTTTVAKLTARKITDWHQGLAEKRARVRTKAGRKQNYRKADTGSDAIRSRRATANRILTVLKAVLNHAWKAGHVASDDAWRRVKPFKGVETARVRYLSEAECVRLVNACEPAFRDLVRGALLTGCRYSELAALRVADFNADAGIVTVRESKAGKPRHVILTDEGQRLFTTLSAGKLGDDPIFTRRSGGRWGKSHQMRPILEACHRAKIKPAISFHVLRHTHGSALAMHGVPMGVIAEQLGHADTRMTEKHYAHLAPSYVAETIRGHFPTLGITGDTNIATMKPRKQEARQP